MVLHFIYLSLTNLYHVWFYCGVQHIQDFITVIGSEDPNTTGGPTTGGPTTAATTQDPYECLQRILNIK